ncbi:ribosomal large subunit pseudouridine synthase D [Streptococcus pyogenes]|nr:ribosomal large subunit pseudouridine synthase D [Streptococcus pyogenes]
MNGIEQNAIYLLQVGDVVTIDIPNEEPFEKLEAIPFDLDIVHEDDHFFGD